MSTIVYPKIELIDKTIFLPVMKSRDFDWVLCRLNVSDNMADGNFTTLGVEHCAYSAEVKVKTGQSVFGVRRQLIPKLQFEELEAEPRCSDKTPKIREPIK